MVMKLKVYLKLFKDNANSLFIFKNNKSYIYQQWLAIPKKLRLFEMILPSSISPI